MRRAEDAGQQRHVSSAHIEPGKEELHRASAYAPVTEQCVAAVEETLCDDDYDNLQQRAIAENLARRVADRELITALAKNGFTGAAQDIFEGELAAYGYPVMMAWTRTGMIIKKVAERGRPLGIDAAPEWSRDERSELSLETVARALAFFREKVLLAGAWDHTRGATIKTYFVGACLFQFPNVYQRWNTERERWRSHCAVNFDDPDDPNGIWQLPSRDRTEERAISRTELRQALAEMQAKDPALYNIVVLKLLEGYTDAQAAGWLDLTPKAVEGMWYRFRRNHRNQRGTSA
jgi:DNA-directed RNA polymerase specialized sigma24 family protein